jgi:hypothetical protein
MRQLTDVFRTDVLSPRAEDGQTMAEYGVVLALITLARCSPASRC